MDGLVSFLAKETFVLIYIIHNTIIIVLRLEAQGVTLNDDLIKKKKKKILMSLSI